MLEEEKIHFRGALNWLESVKIDWLEDRTFVAVQIIWIKIQIRNSSGRMVRTVSKGISSCSSAEHLL